MLKRLRREFVAITMALVGLVLVVALGSAYLTSYTTQHAMTRELLARVLWSDDFSAQLGDTSGTQGADTALTIVVDVDANGDATPWASTPVQIPAGTLSHLLMEALESESSSGESDDYPISWMRAERSDGGWRVALADTYSRDKALRAQATTSLAIFAASMGALFVVVRLLSGWALRPVEEAWSRQRRFVSDASHELKTPLAVILANTQILEREGSLDDETRRWVSSTSEEAGHMKGLVEDLLTLARADEESASGTGSLRREDVNLSELVDGCALEFDAVAFERGCSIECSAAAGVRAQGDIAQLERVVRTLLDNATKYATRGSVVRVDLATEGRHARLCVTNEGEPIAEKDLAHLFDRFYRTDDARERQASGGFGLGLAIAKSIVEAHGGSIAATSTPAGLTTFTVTL